MNGHRDHPRSSASASSTSAGEVANASSASGQTQHLAPAKTQVSEGRDDTGTAQLVVYERAALAMAPREEILREFADADRHSGPGVSFSGTLIGDQRGR
jgi:hypothetical protein